VRTALAEQLLPQASPLNGEPYDRIDAERLAGVLKALADPARLRLLSLIQASPDGEACVCDLTAPIGLSQPTVSHHLRILTESLAGAGEARCVGLLPARAVGDPGDCRSAHAAPQARHEEGGSLNRRAVRRRVSADARFAAWVRSDAEPAVG